jgi:hypothetical protein
MLVATIVGLRAVIGALWQANPAGDPSRYPLLEPDLDDGGDWMKSRTG